MTKIPEDFKWITSDSHFGHANIVKFCYRPGWLEQDYELHNELMIENWQRCVAPDEKILHLGDLFYRCKKARAREIADQLTGDKYLILGNHDTWTKETYEDLGFKVLDPFALARDGWIILFSHYPAKRILPEMINIHGHNHGNSIDGRTKRHKDVGVDLMHLAPVPFDQIVKDCIYRAGESVERDWAPEQQVRPS